MDFVFKRSYRGPLKAAILDWAGTVVDFGCVAPAVVFKRPIIVRRGDRVTLLAKSNAFEVRMEGEALMDASLGDRIRVKNLRSMRIIEGKLSDNGNTVVVY